MPHSFSRFGSALLPAMLLALSACSSTPNLPASAHLRDSDVRTTPAGNIPAPVNISPNVPRPRSTGKTETYSVVVNNVRAQELLFALARDARLNIDIHPGIQGTVTLNAIDQTLQQLLQRIAKQIDMRWELDGSNLAVMPDTPFLRTYKVDYVNLTRDATAVIGASSQITTGASGGGSSGGTAGGSGATGNVSTTRVENKISNRFWTSLESNIKDLLRETDKILPEGSSETVIERNESQSTTGTGAQQANARNSRSTAANGIAGSPNPAALQQDENTTIRRATFREAASVIIHPETGVVTVRATSRQHEKIQEFIDQVTASARRQVMIEATIVEVALSDAYKQGIKWSKLDTTVGLDENTLKPFTLTASDSSHIVKLLEQFGDVKVISSPKLSVLNNQSALLKVVESYVYFNVKADVAASTVAGATPLKAYTTTPQSVSVGLTMTVTPQISENGSITLNVRPSVSSVVDEKQDPNPELRNPNDPEKSLSNLVPVIRTREIESVLRVEDGEIAVLGGLIEDKLNLNTRRVPLVGRIPLLGEIFSARDDRAVKTELVIFLRPKVIRDPSMSGDYKSLRNSLPTDRFFERPAHSSIFGVPARESSAP